MDRIKAGSSSRHTAHLSRIIAAAFVCSAMPVQAAEFLVTSAQDSNSAACTEQQCSLREALLAAAASGEPSVIRLGAGHYGVTIAGSNEDEGLYGDFDIRSDVTIIGQGSASTSIGTAQVNERGVDIAAGAHVRFENVTLRAPVRSGVFGAGSGSETRLSIIDSVIDIASRADRAIDAYGGLEIVNSNIIVRTAPSYGASILFFGKSLDVRHSTIAISQTGIYAAMDPGSTVTLLDSSFSAGGEPSSYCSTINILGTPSVVVERVQVSPSSVPGSVTTCFAGSAIAIRDSSFRNSRFLTPALAVSGNTTISNTTIDGTLRTSGTVALDSVTIAGNLTEAWGVGTSIDNAGGATITASNSVLIGACVGTGVTTALGNNVEAPGNSCALPAASSVVNQSVASLQLPADIALNGATTLNYLPGNGSVLNRVFTPDGIAACRPVDQRGYLRAPECTIGAVETDGIEPALFGHGFDR